jgi:hypothetical protein
MKLNTVLFTLALFGSTLFAQVTVPTEPTTNACPYFGQKIQKGLELTQSQCERITTVYTELAPTFQMLDQKLAPLTDQINYLSWTEDLPGHQAAEKMYQVILERRRVLDEMRRFALQRNRSVLAILDQRQRMFLEKLALMAPVVELFNEGTAAGLILLDPKPTGTP